MTDRYFYTDPLEAAYMAKHFGMKLFVPEDDFEQEELLTTAACVFMAFEKWDEERVFIHPDSLPLLEPKLHDCIMQKCNDGEPYRDCCVFVLEERDLPWEMEEESRIIQRDGKHFFWPEKEA